MGVKESESKGLTVWVAVAILGGLTAGGFIYLWRDNMGLENEVRRLRHDHRELQDWARSVMSDNKLKRSKRSLSHGGVSYVYWGQDDCYTVLRETDATLLYKGRVAGAWFGHIGGGSNYLCLPDKLIYAGYMNKARATAFVYRTEYETYNTVMRNVHNYDVPCAVCHVAVRSTKIMIPGTIICPEGWTTEYYGYLMSSYYHHASQKAFVCVTHDPNMYKLPFTEKDHNGATMYLVRGRSRPHANDTEFDENKPLMCVVCTR